MNQSLKIMDERYCDCKYLKQIKGEIYGGLLTKIEQGKNIQEIITLLKKELKELEETKKQ